MKNNYILLVVKIAFFVLSLTFLCTSHISALDQGRSDESLQVLLHFDDGYSGIYQNAFPLMKDYGYVGTIFVPTNLIDRPKHMKLDHLKEMKDAGWEIGSHTRTHPDLRKLSSAELYDEVVGSRNVLIGDGLLTLENAYFCSPMTTWNTHVALVVSKHYKAARSKELTIFDFPVQPPQHVQVILKDTQIIDIEHWIKAAKKDNVWLILVFHEIAEGGNEYFFSPKKFEEVLKLLGRYKVKVTTIEEAIEYWKKYTSEIFP